MPKIRHGEPKHFEIIGEEPPFSGAMLKELLRSSHVLTRNHITPAKAALDDLATNLNGMYKFARWNKRKMTPHSARIRRMVDQVLELKPLALAIKAHLKEDYRIYEAEDNRTIGTSQIQALERLVSALDSLIEVPQFNPQFILSRIEHKSMESLSGWPALVPALFQSFRDSMATTASPIIGISNGGPAAKFIAAVIPYITGEAPTVGAVGKQLGRSAKVSPLMKTKA